MASKEICCLRGFVTTITSTADYGTDSGSDVIITMGSTSRFFLNGACPDFSVEHNDFSAAVGLASTLSQDLTGKVPPAQLATVQSLLKTVQEGDVQGSAALLNDCLLYTSPSPRD